MQEISSALAAPDLPEDAVQVPLRPGERLIDGQLFYSAAWLNEDLSEVA